MEAKKVYEMLLDIKRKLPLEDVNSIDSWLKDEPLHTTKNFWGSFAHALYVVRNEMLAEESKKAGRTKEQTAMSRILKNACREELKSAWYDKDRLCVCDGYSFVIKSKHNGIALPTTDKPFVDDTDAWLGSHMEYDRTLTETPDLAKLKVYHTERKKLTEERYITYCFGNGVHVQVKYLINMLEAMGKNCEVYIGTPSQPVKFVNDTGVGYLMPIRVKNGESAPRTEL